MGLDRFSAALGQYRRHDRMPPEQIREENRVRFKEFISYVVERSPYYRRIAAERRIDVDSCNPEDFPPLTKADVVEHFDDILTTRDISRAEALAFFKREPPGTLFRGRYYLMHSSGTSGEPSLFAIERDEMLTALLVAYRFFRHRGARKSVMILPTTTHFPSTTMALATANAFSHTGQSVLVSTDESVDGIVEMLNRLQPNFVSSYVGVIARLAAEQRAGRLSISPSDVQVSGEVLFPARRREIEDTFGANVVDLYASCEFLCMGWRDSAMTHLELVEDNLIFEIHEQELYCTGLFNRTFPLIRYRMDDRLEPAGEDPRRIARIHGRTETTVALPDVHGRRTEFSAMSPYTLISKLIADGLISAAQLAVVDDHRVECWIVPSTSSPARLEDLLRDLEGRVRGLFRAQGLDVQQVTARAVADLSIDQRSGKTPALVDLRSQSMRAPDAFGAKPQ